MYPSPRAILLLYIGLWPPQLCEMESLFEGALAKPEGSIPFVEGKSGGPTMAVQVARQAPAPICELVPASNRHYEVCQGSERSLD